MVECAAEEGRHVPSAETGQGNLIEKVALLLSPIGGKIVERRSIGKVFQVSRSAVAKALRR